MIRIALSELAERVLIRSLSVSLTRRLPITNNIFLHLVWRNSKDQFFGVFGSFSEASAVAEWLTSACSNKPIHATPRRRLAKNNPSSDAGGIK
jgi:hypothetical protein